ncbi:formyltransferase family protein [Chlorogloeopsis sp. ULAP01]|uniref:formyltransferase family protein n=1 Tax=Chlorogloeopsis sp. ULAP01 TaxID=3056483 RepID=UPI0025AAEA5E|nr:formyltransferase family protein [Chlorogloeopsis sp. ULAP01]MDM9384588.1 formyltransferase family protein [Chlorogloeopsis sp. ULAP01]
MQKIALFNIECYSSSEAIISFIKEHHDKLAVVVTTDRYSGKHGNLFKQIITNYRRSGFDFVIYLTYNFIVYFWLIYLFRLVSFITSRKRKKFTISEICHKYGIRHIKTSNVNSENVVTKLKQANLDLIVIYFFDQIIREQIIKIPKKGVINVHAALLPECKGLFPVFYSAFKNDSKFGITVHEIEDTSIDSGAILAQEKLEVENTEYSILSLDKLVNNKGVKLVFNIINNFDDYHLKQTPQTLGGSYFSFPTRTDVKNVQSKGFSLVSFKEFISDFLD